MDGFACKLIEAPWRDSLRFGNAAESDSIPQRERRDSGQNDLFKARLDQIIDMNRPLTKLARAIDWDFLEKIFGAVYSDGPGGVILVTDHGGQPPLPARLMAGLAILKHMDDLSDEILCERWLDDPYCQPFCGEEFFRNKLHLERSPLTRWDEKTSALLHVSHSVTMRTGAARPSDFAKVIAGTALQEKAIASPAGARPMHRAGVHLAPLAK